ncbi:MAG: glucose-6-phosphate dehydrogenase [Minisyncoccota bacterium]
MNIPTQIIIFGITGDLSQKKIIPSLFSLYTEGLLPKKLSIIGFSRRDFSKKNIEDFVRGVLSEHDKREDFVKLFNYVQGDFSDINSYLKLLKHVDLNDVNFMQCSNKLYYLSVSPQYYENIFLLLKESGLSFPCGGDLGWARILVEKPFGYDVASSQKLNKLVDSLFQEEQVYRIDHYMAKTSLQDIILERIKPLNKNRWNNSKIKEIKIDLLETRTVENRGEFYDSLGVVYDVGQNHILQMIALVLRDIKDNETSGDIIGAREQALDSLYVESESAHRGQYEGYRTHKGVNPGSLTETYIDITLYSSLPNFVSVPIRVRSGKAQQKSFVAVTMVWKDGTESVFETPSSESQEAYKKVLFDCMDGDQGVFTSGKEVELGWKIAEDMKRVIRQKNLDIY